MFILNIMLEQDSDKNLSALLKAISDTTRRDLLTQLSQHGPARVTDLASMYEISLNAISKHIKVLEKSACVTRKTIGRTHWIAVEQSQLVLIQDWLNKLKSIWELRLDKPGEQ